MPTATATIKRLTRQVQRSSDAAQLVGNERSNQNRNTTRRSLDRDRAAPSNFHLPSPTCHRANRKLNQNQRWKRQKSKPFPIRFRSPKRLRLLRLQLCPNLHRLLRSNLVQKNSLRRLMHPFLSRNDRPHPQVETN